MFRYNIQVKYLIHIDEQCKLNIRLYNSNDKDLFSVISDPETHQIILNFIDNIYIIIIHLKIC